MTRSFSKDVRRRWPGLDYATLERALERSQTALVSRVVMDEAFPTHKCPGKMFSLLQAGLRRNLELSSAFIDAFNAHLCLPTFVLSRAILETGCLVFDAWERLEHAVEAGGRDELLAFDDHIMRAILGTRTSIDGSEPDEYSAPNILSIIDRLERNGISHLRDHYDFMSEYVHPNYPGLISAYTQPDTSGYGVTYLERPAEEQPDLLAHPLVGATVGVGILMIAADGFQEMKSEIISFCARVDPMP